MNHPVTTKVLVPFVHEGKANNKGESIELDFYMYEACVRSGHVEELDPIKLAENNGAKLPQANAKTNTGGNAKGKTKGKTQAEDQGEAQGDDQANAKGDDQAEMKQATKK